MTLRKRFTGKWPPSWASSYGHVNEFVSGEKGILKNVVRRKVYPSGPECLSLEMEYQKMSFSGIIDLKDTGLLEDLYRLLQENLEKSIQDIGDTEIPENQAATSKTKKP